MNTFLNGLKEETNFGYTENGAIKRNTTNSDLLDLFAMGAAMRNRSEEDCILMFQKAYKEDPVYALKCLFYIRDVRGGQGERRFFRTVIKYLAKTETEAVRRNMEHFAVYGRWDDLYCLVDTPLEAEMFAFLKRQLALDVQSKTPSLLAKWLKSENTSSADSRALATRTRKAFGMTSKQYRKTLSVLRTKINIVEKLMSENRWDEIEFDKIPSRAGLIYKNAFARHDIERLKANPEAQTYEAFIKDENTKVNAKVLYPYECVDKAFKAMNGWWGRSYSVPLDDVNRLAVNKYWANLENYFNEATFNGMAIVDTSGSMWDGIASAPINVAISLGLYCAEKANGPFANHFITFSSNPTFVEVQGVDFCDKVVRMSQADWGGSTNIEAAFDLMLNTAIRNKCSQEDIPQNLIIISDMEFDACATMGNASSDDYWYRGNRINNKKTLMESIEQKWNTAGYKMPNLVFWNVNARQNNIPMKVQDGISFVSGMSPSIFQQIMSGKTAADLMYEVLDSERYAVIK